MNLNIRALTRESNSDNIQLKQVVAMDKRRHPRVTLRSMVADISDGKGFFTGTVHDISRFGLALNDIPQKIDSTAEHLMVIVDGHGGHFRLRISPRWVTMAGHQKIIGGQIEQSPLAWTEFVMRLEPEKDDIWGNS